MTKKLTELFELPPDEISSLVTSFPENAELITTEAYNALEKIENALPQVRGLDAADGEMDELASLATSSYRDLMDLGMQVSFSETFNLVSADFVMCSIPIVVSNQIKWLPKESQVTECNSIQEIVNCLNFTWNKIGKDHVELNKRCLIKTNLDAKKVWMDFLNK